RLEKFDSVRESDLETSQRGPEVPAWVPGGKPEGAQNAFPCLRGNGRVLAARLLSRKVGRQSHDSLSGRGLGPGAPPSRTRKRAIGRGDAGEETGDAHAE